MRQKTRAASRRTLSVIAEALESRQLFAAGDLDLSFGNAGRQTVTFTGSTDDYSQALVTQPDGKMVGAAIQLTGMPNFAIARYTASGALDPTFGTAGKQVIDFGGYDQVYGVALAPDGKIVAVGTSSPTYDPSSTATDFAIARLNPDGSPDTSFNATGRLTIDFGGSVDGAFHAAVQSDGKIVFVGDTKLSGASGYVGVIARLNADGTPDGSFGAAGVVKTPLGSSGGWSDLTIDAAGRILVGGRASGGAADAAGDAAIARFNPDGTPDTTFGSNGLTITSIGPGNDSIGPLRIDASGKIVVAGVAGYSATGPTSSTRDDALVMCYNSDGTLDTSFGTSGYTLVDFPVSGASRNDLFRSLQLMSDGRIVAGGSSRPVLGISDYADIARLTPSGALDTSFGAGGKLLDTGSNVAQLVVDSDGSVVAAGQAGSGAGTGWDLTLTRYTAAGAIDPAFGSAGRIFTDFQGPTYSALSAAARQGDGKVVGVGYATVGAGHLDDFAVVRFNSDGSIDPAFGSNGSVLTDFTGQLDRATAVAVQPDGKIIAGGFTTPATGQSLFALARYNPNGSPDTSFGTLGRVTVPAFVSPGSGDYDDLTSVVVRPDGTIVVVGSSNDTFNTDPRATVVTLSATGAVTSTQRLAPFNAHNDVIGAALDSAGRLVVAVTGTTFGSAPDQIGAYRFTPSGALDTTFGTNGLAKPTVPGAFTSAAMAVQSDGGVLITGSIATAPGDFAVVRLTSAGVLDTAFDADGLATVNFGTGTTDAAVTVASQSDGHVLIAGTTRASGSGATTNLGVARLNADGSPDATYGTAGHAVITGTEMQVPAASVVYPGGALVIVGSIFPVSRRITVAAVRVQGDPVAPGAADPGGPYSVPERGTVALTASGDGTPGTFEWDLDYDGHTFTVDATGATATFAANDLDGPTTRTVAVRLHATSGLVGAAGTTTVTVTDAGPTATLSNSGPVQEASAATVSFSSVTDVSADTAAGFLYSYDFDNNGSFEITNSASPAATVPAAYLTGVSSRTVRARVTDKDGGSTDYTTTITVTTPANATLSYPSTVNEGSPATLTWSAQTGAGPYTYSYDYDNDGIWEVTGATSTSNTVPSSYFPDGPASRTLRARVNGPGGYTDHVITISVLNRAPVVSLGPMPVGAKEGVPVTITASATDQSPADVAAGFTFNWTVLKNGAAFLTTTAPSLTFTPPDNATYNVSVTATDKDGATSAFFTSAFSAANVAPTATFVAPASAPAGSTTTTVSFTAPADVSADTAAGFLYSYDFDNNGTFEIADSSAATALIPSAYLTGPASRTVRARVKDKDGGFTDYTATISIRYPAPAAAFSAPASVPEGTASVTSRSPRPPRVSPLTPIPTTSTTTARSRSPTPAPPPPPSPPTSSPTGPPPVRSAPASLTPPASPTTTRPPSPSLAFPQPSPSPRPPPTASKPSPSRSPPPQPTPPPPTPPPASPTPGPLPKQPPPSPPAPAPPSPSPRPIAVPTPSPSRPPTRTAPAPPPPQPFSTSSTRRPPPPSRPPPP